MPFKLVPPQEGRTPYYRVRGTYHRIYIDRSTQTRDVKIARKILKRWQEDVERGVYERPDVSRPAFPEACISYMQAGGERRFLPPLLKHFGDKPLDEINQAAIDGAAEALYPDAPGATRNRQVYSPISAVLRHAGVVIELKRPKGSRGQNRLHWFKPEDAGKFLNGAYEVSDRFGALCTFLLYTGCRLSEGLNLRPEDVWLQERYAYVRKTKNGEPRPVHLTPDALAALANLKWGKPRVFGMTKCGRIYTWFSEAEAHSCITIPKGIAFHIFRHTYGAWMRRYGGLDTSALVETGAWKSRQSAAVYEHVDASEEAKKADALPLLLAKVTSASDLLAPIPT